MDDFIGSVAISLAGKDSGSIVVVLSDDEGYVSYADGRKHKLQTPKRKRKKHIRILGKSSVTDISTVTNKQLRRLLNEFESSGCCAPEKEE